MEPFYFIALLIGVAGSTVVHLSQGMMRLAIARRGEDGARALYLAGMTMNFSAPLWVILANRFGPTVLYTSVYAVGLVALLIFSCVKLGHRARPSDMAGAGAVAAGAALLAGGTLAGGTPPMAALGAAPLFFAGAGAVGMLAPVWWMTARRRRLPVPEGIVLGGLGGVFLALDSLLKGVAQSDSGEAAFLPATAAGAALFAMSFAGAGLAFAMTQWAHTRSAPPSQTIAGYDAAYVAAPVFLVPLAAGGAGMPNAWCYAGLACLALGLFLLGAAHPSRPAAAVAGRWMRRNSAARFAAIRPFLRGRTLLDVGAAEGYIGECAAQHAGMDVRLADVVDLNRTELPLDLYDGHTLPYSEKSFDTVTVLLTLHHCAEPDCVLSEVRRVARERVIVTESVYRTRAGRRMLYLMDRAFNGFRSEGSMPVCLHFRTARQWREAFKEAGLTVEHEAWVSRGLHKQRLFILSPR